MLSKYKDIFTIKGAKTFTIAGLLGRLGFALIGLGIISSITKIYDDKYLGPKVSAVFVICYAFINPQISKLIDKYGQKKILSLFIFSSPLSLLILSIAIESKSPAFYLYTLAIIASPLPNISALTRTRWKFIVKNNEQLESAFSLETILDEASFVLGPALAILINYNIYSSGSLFLTVILITFSLFSLLKATETQPKVIQDINGQTKKMIFSYPGIMIIVSLVFLLGVIAGGIDSASIVIAKNSEKDSLSIIPVMLYALISCIAGLKFGTMKINKSKEFQLLIASIFNGVTAIPLLFTNNITSLTILVIFAGMSFAPAMILSNQIVEKRIPVNRLTQALSYISASLAVGVALGSGTTSIIAEQFGDDKILLGASIAGILTLIVIFFGYKKLTNYIH